MNRTVKIKWLITLTALGIVAFTDIAAPDTRYAVVTLWAILMWMLELMPEAAVAMALPVFYILLHIAVPEIAFKAWSTGTPWITLGGLVIGQVIIDSGLVKRIAYKALLITGGSLNGIILGLTATCLLMAPFIPSIMAKAALMTPMVVGICQVLHIEKKSTTASALFLAVFLALWSPKMAFLTASTDSVLTANILIEYCGQQISWLGWAKDMFLPSILWTFLSISLIYILQPTPLKLEQDYLKQQYRTLGKMSGAEKKTLLMILILLTLLITDSYHNINISWIMIIVATACFLPVIQLADGKTFEKVPFSVVIFLVAALTIGNVTTATGIADKIIGQVTPLFVNTSNYQFIMLLYIFGLLSIFLLNPLALVGTLLESVANICTDLGYPAVLGGYAMIMGFNLAIFPYEVAPLMLMYGSGYIKLDHLVKIMLIRVVAGLIFTSLVTYPYWNLMGLLK